MFENGLEFHQKNFREIRKSMVSWNIFIIKWNLCLTAEMVLATLSKITKVLNWLIVNSLGEYCSILSKINVKTFYSKLLSQLHVELKLLLINKKKCWPQTFVFHFSVYCKDSTIKNILFLQTINCKSKVIKQQVVITM